MLPPIFLFGLPGTDAVGLGFLGGALRSTTPELRVESLGVGGELWRFQRTLIGAAPGDTVVTLEDGIWRQIRSFNRAGEVFTHQDYATGAGFSLRFGDGEFGAIPPEGTLFRVTYRSGPGRTANVPGGAITALEIPGKARELPSFVAGVTNPVEVTTGVDPESQKDIKLLTPEAYRAQTYFAVRPTDYGEQAERLDFIQTANGTQRYTGSWNSIFVAGDALGSNSLSDQQTAELTGWMDCVRQAGRDVIVKQPKPAPIDLEIRVCIEAFAHPGEVLDQVEEVLLGPGVAGRMKGFFHPDNFTFGTHLHRSTLEATIQAVPGVRSVRRMRVRVRGSRRFSEFTELRLEVEPDEILRLDNDPLRPGNGTLTLIPEGGA